VITKAVADLAPVEEAIRASPGARKEAEVLLVNDALEGLLGR
jgi:hypothetical protein